MSGVTPLPPVIVETTGGTLVEVEATHIQVEVSGGFSQQNMWVGPVRPEFSAPGLWVETGLGANGDDFTIWIEDGS
jgi:hypothetical protein